MSISLGQIHTILKTYNRQVKQERPEKSNKNTKADKSPEVVDQVTISSEAKKRQFIDRIISQAIDRFPDREQKEVFTDELLK